MLFLRWLPVVVWLFVISFLSFSSLEKVPLPSFIGVDKLGHFGMYFILELFFLLPLRNNQKALVIATFIAAFFSGITELIQHYFIANRYGEFADLIANIAGLVVGFFIVKKRIKT